MNNVEKNTIDYMRLVAKERGGDCLSKKYVNARTKLKWQCSCSKTWFATPSDILRPSWCRSCSVGLMERVCRCYFEQIFGEQFPNIRPKWLVNPKTGQKLEIDGYSEKLKVAFEYQGIQHIRFNSLYHKTESDFQNRLDLDLVKAELIKQKGIKLVLINQIPTFLKYKDLRGYLLSEFKRLKIKHPPFPKDFDLKNAYKTNDKYFLDRIKNAAKELGGRLKSEVYLGTHVPHDFECGKGHGTFSLKPAKLLTDGRWCQKCSSEKKKNDVDLVTSNEFKKFKIVFISGSYEKISSKLRWKCLKCNEEFNSTISGLRERIKLKNEPCLYCVQGYKRNTSEFLLDYEQAKIIVHKLGLKSQEEWKKYCNGRLPHLEPLSKKIPKSPWVVYKKSGWISLGDWLGTEVVATHKRKYRPFKEARDFARSLKLKSSMEWILFSKNKLKGLPYYPSDIPKLPNDSRYKNEGWKSWADWLGTNNTKGEFWDFEKAKKFVRRLSLSSTAEWKKYCNGKLKKLPAKPNPIPRTPHQVYKDKGWLGMEDWLGYEKKRNIEWLSYEEAKKWVWALKLNKRKMWKMLSEGKLKQKKPKNIPSNPAVVYKNEWEGWEIWLGSAYNGRVAFKSFEEAREYVRKLKIKNRDEWNRYVKSSSKHKNIPAVPHLVYKSNGWKGYGDWLGTNKIANQNRKFRSFESARSFARSLNLSSQIEWNKFCKGEIKGLPIKPLDIPSDPRKTYLKIENKWFGWKDWLQS